MSVDWSFWTFLFNVIVFVINVVLFVFQWLNRRHNARKEELGKVDGRVTENEQAIAEIKKDIEHMPTQAQITALSNEIHALNGTLQELGGRFSGVERQVGVIHQYLIGVGQGSNR